MSNLQKKVKVYNRTDGALGYAIEALRISRLWTKPGDYLNIEISELLELKTVPGGMYIVENCIMIDDEEALKIVFDDQEIEPEYKYGLKEVDYLLYEASLEQFLDALDYSPKGVLDLILANAKIKLPNTTAKISAINDKFGININRVFELTKDSADDVEDLGENKSSRRAAPIQTKTKAKAPEYKIVKKDK